MMSTITTMSNFGFWLSAMQNFRGCLLLSRQNSACTEHAAPLSAMACEQPPMRFGGWAHPFGISLGRDHRLRLVNHIHELILRVLRKVGQAAGGRAGVLTIPLVTIRGNRTQGAWGLKGSPALRAKVGALCRWPHYRPAPTPRGCVTRPQVRIGRGETSAIAPQRSLPLNR